MKPIFKAAAFSIVLASPAYADLDSRSDVQETRADRSCYTFEDGKPTYHLEAPVPFEEILYLQGAPVPAPPRILRAPLCLPGKHHS